MWRVLSVALLAGGPVQEWDGHSTVQLEVGKAITLHVKGCCSRFTVSGADPFELQVVGPDTFRVVGVSAGAARISGWRSDGTTVRIPLQIGRATEPAPVDPPQVAPNESAPTREDLYLEASVEPAKPRVGQRVTLSLILYSRVDVSVDKVALPDLSGFEVTEVDFPRGAELKVVEGVPYKSYAVARRALVPRRPGAVTIGPAQVDVIETMLFRTSKAHRESKPLTLEVLP